MSLSYDPGFPFWPVFMGFPSKDLPMPQSFPPPCSLATGLP